MLFGRGQAAQYLNRRLLECEPLTYVIEPLELIGKGMSIDRGYHNEYGDCTGLTPGPPFIIEMPIMIGNEYNEDGTVLHYGSFSINNGYIKANGEAYENTGAFEFVFGGANPANVITLTNNNGYLTCTGKPGDPVIFSGSYRIASNTHLPRQDYANTFTYCTFMGKDAICASNSTTLDFLGGNTTFDNCVFKYFGSKDQHCLFFQGVYAPWDVSVTNCLFEWSTFSIQSPLTIMTPGTVELENIHFRNIGVLEEGYRPPLIDFTGGIVRNNIKNITASDCRFPYLEFGMLEIYDSVYIRNELPMVVTGYGIWVDSNATLVIDSGSVLQFGYEGSIDVKYGKLVVDSSVLTTMDEDEYGFNYDNDPQPSLAGIQEWGGIEISDSSSLDIKNSRLRFAMGPIYSTGSTQVDSTIIEYFVGRGIDILGVGGKSHKITNSVIRRNYDGNGVGIKYQTGQDDVELQRLEIENVEVRQCGGDALEIFDNMYNPKPLDVFIKDSKFYSCGDKGMLIHLMPALDTLLISGSLVAANGLGGIFMYDRGGTEAVIRMESNMVCGNGYKSTSSPSAVWVDQGKADFINNSVIFNKGTGILNSSPSTYEGTVTNNLFAYNGVYGFSRSLSNGYPIVSYNDFYENDIDGENEINLRPPTGAIYTFDELIALGGIAYTNKNYDPGFIPSQTGLIQNINYDSTTGISKINVRDFPLKGRSYAGRLMLPDIKDTVWYYILENTDDTISIMGKIRDYAEISDTFLVFDQHLSMSSALLDSGYNDVVTVEKDYEGQIRVCDADTNGTATVDIGADEYQPDSSGNMAGILVFSPSEDSLYRPGETVDIYWESQGVDYVHVFYAVAYQDMLSANWQEIELGLGADEGHCQWAVPDTISYKCRVLVQDALHSEVYGQSGIFHIKPPVLTRLLADSTYERFRVTEDNWQFENTEANMWPSSWYNQTIYTLHLDIYTGEYYPVEFNDPPIRALPYEFPNWPLFVGTFGTEQCYMYVGGKMLYRQRALEYWASIKDDWGGSCYGLSNSAMMAFGDSAVFKNHYPAVGTFGDLYPVTMTDNIRTTINRFMVTQHGEDEIEYMDANDKTPLKTVVEKCYDLFGNNKYLNDLGALTICDMDNPVPDDRGCHTVVPYKLEPHMSDPDKFWIYVYDCNIPTDSTTRVLVDTSLNFWTYDSLSWDSHLDIWIEQPLSTFLTRPKIPGIEGDDSKNAAENYYLFFAKADSVRVTSSVFDEYNILGDSLDNSLVDGMPLVFKDKFGRPPYGLYLPNGDWDCSITGPNDSLARVTLMSDRSFMTYYRSGVDSEGTDHITYPGDDSTVWVRNEGGAEISYGLKMCYNDNGGEYLMHCKGIETSSGDSSCFKFNRQFGYVIENYGQASDYILEIHQLDSLYNKDFADSNAHIDSNTALYIKPGWGDDYIDSMLILVDTDIDGTINDTIVVINDILLDIDDEESNVIPTRFELNQNYPNPFNPVTSISYSIPTRSQVTIEIFNLLGQKVSTLVDGVKPAGNHGIEWDGRDMNGRIVSTGVYLYRFQAGDHVETKKMLLVK